MRSLRRPSPPTTRRRRGCGAGILACAGSALLAVLALGLGPSSRAATHATTPTPAASAHTASSVSSAEPATAHWYAAYTVMAPVSTRAPGHPGLTSVSGWLVVPRVIEPGTASTGTAIWLGLEGTGHHTGLVQAGVRVYPGRLDKAWVATCGSCAMTPAPSSDTVSAGDHLHVSVAWLGSDHWLATIRDSSAGWTWTDRVSFPEEVDAQALFAAEWGPFRLAAPAFRWWWPTTTWRHGTGGLRGHGTYTGGGCIRLAHTTGPSTPFTFANCPT